MTSFDPPDQHRIPNRYKINFRPENHTSHISLNGDVVFSNTKQSFKPTLLSASLQVPSNLGSALSISRRRAPLIPSTVDISDITAAGQEEEKVQQQQQVKAFQTTESLTATVNTKNKSQEKCQTLEAYAQRVQQNDSGDMLLKEFIKYQLDAYQPNFLPNFSKMREEMTKAMAKPEVKKNPFWIHDLLRLLRLTLLDRQSDVLFVMDTLSIVILAQSNLRCSHSALFAIFRWCIHVCLSMDGCSLPSSVRVELDNLAKQTLEDIFSVTDDDDNQLFIHRSCIYLIVEACAATYGTVQEENYYSLFRRLRERRPNFIQHLVNCMCTADQSVLKWLIKELSSHRLNWNLAIESQITLCSLVKNIFIYLRMSNEPRDIIDDVGLLLGRKFSNPNLFCNEALFNIASLLLLINCHSTCATLPNGFCLRLVEDVRFLDELIHAISTMIEQAHIAEALDVYRFAFKELNPVVACILQRTFLQFIKQISFKSIPMLDTELRMKLQFFFAEVCLCFEKSFYMPLIQLLQSENLASNEILRGIIFLMEIMGDAHFWFGISGEVPFYTEVVHRENNVANTIFPRSDKSKQGKIVGSNLSSAASIASARIQCALHYIDLLVLVIVGKDLLRPCHTGQRIQFTLGHVAVVMEFIWMIRRLRKSSKSDLISAELVDSLKLALHQVEDKVSDILLIRLRQGCVLTDAAKTILVSVLMEIRVFTDYNSRPEWMSLVLEWCLVDIPRLLVKENNQEYAETRTNEPQMVVDPLFERLRQLYEIGSREFALLDESHVPDHYDMFTERIRLAFTDQTKGFYFVKESSILVRGLPYALLSALVPLYPFLETQELATLLHFIWQNIPRFDRLLSRRAGFLLLYCADHQPKLAKSLIVGDLYDKDPRLRIAALLKFSSLFYKRQYAYYQILSSEAPQLRGSIDYVLRKSKQSPYHLGSDFQAYFGAFKAPAQNLPFVTPDFGTDASTPINLPNWLARLKDFTRENSELKADKNEATAKERNRRIQTPLMALPGGTLLETDFSSLDSKVTSSFKTKTIFPVAFNLISYAVVDMLHDEHAGVHNVCREIISNVLRDDPVLLLRPYFNDLPVASFSKQKEILTRLRRILLSRRTFPTTFTYMLFNYLLGFLSWASKASRMKENRDKLACLILPLLADLTSRIQGLSIKDFKKNRMEYLIMTMGSFWFKNGSNSMFRRHDVPDEQPFKTKLTRAFIGVATIRISQCHLMMQFILRNPSDVDFIRRELIAELANARKNSFIKQMLPYNPHSLVGADMYGEKSDMIRLIILYCKALLHQLDVLITFTDRTYDDLAELGDLIEEINWILLRFAYDHTIVRQAIAIYLTIVYRFKRTFSTRGYKLFLPTLVDLLDQAIKNKDERVRGGILFAFGYFYRIHEESFILQFFGVLHHKANDRCSIGSFINEIWMSLENPHKVDRLQVHTIAPDLSDVEIQRNFQLHDAVKLLASIIAYNPFCARAAQALCLLQILTDQIATNDLQFQSRLLPLLDSMVLALLPIFSKYASFWSSIKQKLARKRLTSSFNEMNQPWIEADDGNSDKREIDWKISNRIEFVRLTVLHFQARKKYFSQQSSTEDEFEVYQENHFAHLMDILHAISRESRDSGKCLNWEFLLELTKNFLIPASYGYFGLSLVYIFTNSLSILIKSRPRSETYVMVDCICEFLEKPYLPVMKHEYVVSLIYHNFFLELLSVYDNPQKMSSNSQNPPKQTALTKDSTEYDYSFVRLMVTISVYYKDIWQDVQKIMHVPSSRFVARIFIPFCKQIGRRALMRGPHVVHYRNGERTIARIILNIISYNSRAINAVMLEIPIRHSTIPSSVLVNTDSSSRRSSPATTDHNTRRRESSAHSTSSSHISVPLELTDADQQLFLLTIVHFLCIFYGSKHLIAKERPGIWHELATFISHTFSDESINQETICIFVELIVQSKLLLIMQPLIPFIHDQIWRLKYKIATIQRLAADVHNFSGIKVKDNSRAASSALIVGQQPPIDYNAPGGRSSQSVATALGSPALRLPKKSGSLANVISKAPSELVNSVSTFDSALWAEKILAALDDKISPAWTEDRILDFITSHLGSKK